MTIEEFKFIDKFMGIDHACDFIDYTDYNNWNNLIQVVEKIEKLVYNVRTHSSPTISGRWYMYTIEFYNYGKKLDPEIIVKVQSDYTNNETKISAYFRAVIEFIKYYNKEHETIL